MTDPSRSGAAGDPAGSRVIRVMLVDDSAVIRGMFTRVLEADPEIQVVASVGDGKMAVNTIGRTPVDVVVLDIEMPVMDGLTAVPLLLAAAPSVQIIMASTLTRKNADVSMKALAAGAKDYVTKPSSTSEINSANVFKEELIARIKALAGGPRPPRAAQEARHQPRAPAALARPAAGAPAPALALPLRPPMMDIPAVLAIGSSTGGPQALFTVIGNLPAALRQPILITQHMPATFTASLAEHLQRIGKRPCAEGQDGEPVQPGHIYVAPGEHHMVVELVGGISTIRLNKEPPENFCRPSVDPMLRSLAAVYRRRVLVAMLTGMGQDGLRGSEAVVRAGGAVIAQDEATSVVWGMPGAVANAGLCSAVLPLDRIASCLQRAALRSAA